MTNNKTLFLKQARLQNFRTIQDTAIDFEPGLNIIIGQNGVGKSNVLLYLKSSINFNIQPFSHHNANLQFFLKEDAGLIHIDIKSNIENVVENGSAVIKTNPVNFTVRKGTDNGQTFESHEDFYNFLNREELLFSPIFIAHGLPDNYPLVAAPLSFKINKEGVLEDFAGFKAVRESSHCLENLLHLILYQGLELYRDSNPLDKKDVETIITNMVDNFKPVEAALKSFTDIIGIRINKSFNLVHDKMKGEFSVSNLYLEFKVGKQWLPFSHLSDGMRRLFYIISEITFPTLFYFQGNQFTVVKEAAHKIVLIEEPELGLHPRQLDALLLFLEEQSREHQIIVTTHAPQALDVLKKDQLEKIIIARLTSNGTKLRHLNDKEKKKAALYMEEEAYLSDYWRFSDLEK